jgi:hypothetical protein
MKRPTPSVFKSQLEFLDRYADLREDRGPEIITQMDMVRAFFMSIPYIRPDRTKWTLELLEAAHRMSILVEMRFKHAFACRRPIEYSPQVQPVILTPSHATLPSGHSCESFMAAVVLWMLLRESTIAPYSDVSWGEQLMRESNRIAINRTVAGVHFPLASAAGAVLGLTLGQYFVNRCTGAATYEAWSFDGTKYPEPSAKKPPPLDGDFYWRELYDVDAKPSPGQKAPPPPYDYAAKLGSQQIGNASPLLAWLWNKAKAEWS